MDSKQLAIVTILIALSIGTNYAMISLPNVKLMDFVVFIGGFCFGSLAGSLIGIISWAVYGTLNPMGFSLPIWLSTMLSEPIYAVAGAFLRKRLDLNDFSELKNERVTVCIFFGILGMFLTFAYDLITNVVFGYVSGWNILFAIIFGFVPFGLVHMVSNGFFFGIGGFSAINAVLNIIGGENSGISKK